ncbi:hypothetical protein C2S51_022634 [Perilla frutescens var. frutescens]|nr:hypothetical protein C2S51_022634 [Perilla frutescens var. frutescens]
MTSVPRSGERINLSSSSPISHSSKPFCIGRCGRVQKEVEQESCESIRPGSRPRNVSHMI